MLAVVRRSRSVLLVGLVVAGTAVLAGPATAAGVGARLSPSGALVQPTASSRTVSLAAGAACQTLLTRPGGQCGLVDAPAGRFLFTIEAGPSAVTDPASRPFMVTIYRPLTAERWVPALQTQPTDGAAGPLFATVIARTATLAGAGPSLVIGYRSDGSGAFLAVDVVVGSRHGPRVGGHLLLDQGVAVIRSGQLVTYASVYRPRDANCCPSFVERTVVGARGTGFVIDQAGRLRIGQVQLPDSELG